MKTHNIITVSGIVSEQWPKPCPPLACMGEAFPRFNPDSLSHWNLSCCMATFSFPAPPIFAPRNTLVSNGSKEMNTLLGALVIFPPKVWHHFAYKASNITHSDLFLRHFCLLTITDSIYPSMSNTLWNLTVTLFQLKILLAGAGGFPLILAVQKTLIFPV